MIRLIGAVTFVVPGTAGARAPVVVEKFGAELRRAPAQFHHCFCVEKLFGKIANHNLEKLCRLHSALNSTIPVLDLEKACPRKVSPWP